MADQFDKIAREVWSKVIRASGHGERDMIVAEALRIAVEGERKACAEVARSLNLPSRHVMAPGTALAAAIEARSADTGTPSIEGTPKCPPNPHPSSTLCHLCQRSNTSASRRPGGSSKPPSG